MTTEPPSFAAVARAADLAMSALKLRDQGTAAPEQEPGSIAHHVLWQFGDLEHGLRPGSFTEALLELCARSDPGNRRRLAHAFPLHVAFVEIAQTMDDGMAILRDFAREAAEYDQTPRPITGTPEKEDS